VKKVASRIAFVLLTIFACRSTALAAVDLTNAVAKVEALGGIVRAIASSSNALEVDLQFSGVALKDNHLEVLTSFPHISVLRLKNTGLTDAGLSHVAKVTTLQRLDLSGTAITDAGLKQLTHLPQLASLNLFGTVITDEGLLALKTLPALTHLFVGQTKVSAEGIARLQVARPGLRITPDPAADREHARVVEQTAAAALARAEEALPRVKQESAEILARGEQASKDSEAAKKRADEAPSNSASRKESDAKAQAAEEASKQSTKAKERLKAAESAVTTARQQLEEARREAEKLSATGFLAPRRADPAVP
jgi:hypothetical protein